MKAMAAEKAGWIFERAAIATRSFSSSGRPVGTSMSVCFEPTARQRRSREQSMRNAPPRVVAVTRFQNQRWRRPKSDTPRPRPALKNMKMIRYDETSLAEILLPSKMSMSTAPPSAARAR
eukprot:Amastigsp_a508383_708.p3 type:complete len:120 gc:universal Amastigsp_a508383_708:151-510(+)